MNSRFRTMRCFNKIVQADCVGRCLAQFWKKLDFFRLHDTLYYTLIMNVVSPSLSGGIRAVNVFSFITSKTRTCEPVCKAQISSKISAL